MGKERLVLEQDRDGLFYIKWFFPDQNDLGGTLGEAISKKPTVTDSGHDAATAAVWDLAEGRDFNGCFWETKSKAQAALKTAKWAVAEFNGAKPWPEWAKQAVAAGWKPPKGWTP